MPGNCDDDGSWLDSCAVLVGDDAREALDICGWRVVIDCYTVKPPISMF